MPARPEIVVLDVIETVVSLAGLRRRLESVGRPEALVDLWFAKLLRNGFALAAAGSYRPFPEVAAGALRDVADLSDEQVKTVLDAFSDLDAHPDAEPALRRLVEAGIRVVTLTNGTTAGTHALLERNGLAPYVDEVFTIDQAQAWKPSAAPYRLVIESCGRPAERLALVAAHSWDVHGARQAGFTTGWLSRLEGDFVAPFDPPDVRGRDLVEVVEALLELPPGA